MVDCVRFTIVQKSNNHLSPKIYEAQMTKQIILKVRFFVMFTYMEDVSAYMLGHVFNLMFMTITIFKSSTG